MKLTTINCDMCRMRIYQNGRFGLRMEEGTIAIQAKVLTKLTGYDFDASGWKRRKYHICPKCVMKIKEYCRRGMKNEND